MSVPPIAYQVASQAPHRGQFESDSAPCQSYNCGPTDAAFIDGYYHDRRLSIDAVRRLAVSQCQPTTADMVVTMLSRLGIPAAHAYGFTISGLNAIDVAHRPVAFAVRMLTIPDGYSGDGFDGNHWFVAAAKGIAYGVPSHLCMDSNAPASTGGFHWIPDSVLARAMYASATSTQTALRGEAVVPTYAKKLVVPTGTLVGHRLVVGPGTVTGWKVDRYTHKLTAPKPYPFARPSATGLAVMGSPGFWEVVPGPKAGLFGGYYLVAGHSGAFRVQRIYRQANGSLTYVSLPGLTAN